MNTDSSQDPTPPFPETLAGTPDEVAWVVRVPPARKFQHNYRTHILLFALTFVTTTYRETVLYPLDVLVAWFQTGVWHNVLAPFAWPYFLDGLWFSLPLLTILSAHEFGHYVLCRIHNVDATLPPMGLRLRLKASFDTSTLKPQAKILAEAMKKYGMIVADNGSNWYFSGSSDRRWDDENLDQLKRIPGSAFQVVKSAARPHPC